MTFKELHEALSPSVPLPYAYPRWQAPDEVYVDLLIAYITHSEVDKEKALTELGFRKRGSDGIGRQIWADILTAEKHNGTFKNKEDKSPLSITKSTTDITIRLANDKTMVFSILNIMPEAVLGKQVSLRLRREITSTLFSILYTTRVIKYGTPKKISEVENITELVNTLIEEIPEGSEDKVLVNLISILSLPLEDIEVLIRYTTPKDMNVLLAK